MENGFLKEEEKEFQRTYSLSLWWVNHREQLKNLGVLLLAALDGVLLCFVLWTLTDSFLISYSKERLAVAEMVAYGQADLNATTRATAALSLQPGDAAVLAGEENSADVYVPLTNPNTDWWAEFDYVFQVGEAATKTQHGFILPGEKDKPILALATTELGSARAVEFLLSNVVWHRVDKHQTGAYEAWAKARLSFVFKDVEFATNVPLAGKTIGQARFTVINASPYGYYNPVFAVLLKRGSSIVGVNQTTLQSLDAGESRDVVIDWFGALPAVGEIQVVPIINVFDPAVYKSLPSGASIDTRNIFVPNR